MNEPEPNGSLRTLWHQLLGKLLEILLTPVGILVKTEVQVMSKPPKADILLLQRENDLWTPEQLAFLPDGIRNSTARYILLEFKYTESLNLDALIQAVSYDYFYRQSQKLAVEELQTFVVSARTPRTATLEQFEYVEGDLPGVYHSQSAMLARVPLLVLNQLRNVRHNAYIKCFASQKRAKDAAFATLARPSSARLPDLFWQFIAGLRRLLSMPKGADMEEGYTPEMVMEIGEVFLKQAIQSLPPEERLAGLPPEERLAGLPPEERLAGLPPEERLAGLPPEERLAAFSEEDIESILLQHKNRLFVLTLKEKGLELSFIADLVGLTIDEVNAILAAEEQREGKGNVP